MESYKLLFFYSRYRYWNLTNCYSLYSRYRYWNLTNCYSLYSRYRNWNLLDMYFCYFAGSYYICHCVQVIDELYLMEKTLSQKRQNLLQSVLWMHFLVGIRVRMMVSNTAFHNISLISWRSVLLVEETGVPVENNRPVASHWQILSHNILSSTHCPELHNICEFI